MQIRAQKNKNIIQTIGRSSEAIYPDSFTIVFALQEGEKRLDYLTVIGKTSIDTLTLDLLKRLKTYKLEKKDLKPIEMTSFESAQRVYMTFLYETVVPDKETAVKIVNELRFNGLKGIMVEGIYTRPPTQLVEKMHASAITDARNNAISLAKLINKQVGEIISCRVGTNCWSDNLGDYNKNYNRRYDRKFEMNFQERKFINFEITVEFDLK